MMIYQRYHHVWSDPWAHCRHKRLDLSTKTVWRSWEALLVWLFAQFVVSSSILKLYLLVWYILYHYVRRRWPFVDHLDRANVGLFKKIGYMEEQGIHCLRFKALPRSYKLIADTISLQSPALIAAIYFQTNSAFTTWVTALNSHWSVISYYIITYGLTLQIHPQNGESAKLLWWFLG